MKTTTGTAPMSTDSFSSTISADGVFDFLKGLVGLATSIVGLVNSLVG